MSTILSDRAFNNPSHQMMKKLPQPLGADKAAMPTVYALVSQNDFLREGPVMNNASSKYVEDEQLSTSIYSRGSNSSKAYSSQGKTLQPVYKFKGEN